MTTANNDAFRAILLSYVGGFRLGARKAMPLSKRLELAAPDDLTPEERARLEMCKGRAQDVDDVLSSRERGASKLLRDRRNRHAQAWTALLERMAAAAGLPREAGAHVGKAVSVVGSLFTDGVAFTTLEGVEAWQHGARLLARIEREGLRADVVSLAGPGYLEWVERMVAELGTAIGVTNGTELPPPVRALSDAVGRFVSAVSSYARVMAATVDEEDDASVARFTRALAPIDEMRSTYGSSDDDDEPPLTPTDVTPASPVLAGPTTPVVTPVTPIDPGLPGADPFIRSQ